MIRIGKKNHHSTYESNISVTPLRKQPKRLYHAGIEITIFRVGMQSKSLYKTFLQSPQGDDSSLAATALLAKLDKKRRDRWSEAVRSTDLSHSTRKYGVF